MRIKGAWLRGGNLKVVSIVGLVLGALLFSIAFRDIELGSISAAIAQARVPSLAWLLAALIFFFWLKAVRWKLLLGSIATLSVRDLMPAIYFGYVVNVIVPHVGEVVRCITLAKKIEGKTTPLLATILVERIFDFAAVLLLVAAGIYLSTDIPDELSLAAYFIGATALAMFLFTICAISFPTRFLQILTRTVRPLPSKISACLVTEAEAALVGIQTLREPSKLFVILVLSISQWAASALTIYFAIHSLGIDANLATAFIVLGLIVAGLTVPTAPGYLGTIQFCFVTGLVPFQVSHSEAFAVSVIFNIMITVPAFIIAAYYSLVGNESARKGSSISNQK